MNNVHGIDDELINNLEKEIDSAQLFLTILKDGVFSIKNFGENTSIAEELRCYDDIGNCIQKLVTEIFEKYGSIDTITNNDYLPNTTSTD